MKQSFGYWLAAIFITSTILPLALLSLTLTRFFNQMFEEETDRLFMTSLVSVSHNVTTYINDLSRLSMTPYYQGELITYLHYMNDDRYATDSVAAWRVNKDYRLAITQQLDASRGEVVGVLLAPIQGEGDCGYLVRRYADSLEVLTELGTGDSDWYQGTIQADGKVYFSTSEPDYYATPNYSYFFTAEGRNTFSVSRLIKDPDSMRPIGVLKVDAIDTMIQDIFVHIPTNPLSALMLIAPAGNVIYTTNGKEHLAGLLEDESTRLVTDETDSYRVSVAPITSTPWRLCFFASQQKAKERAWTIISLTGVGGMVCFLVAGTLFYLVYRQSVRSMGEILTALRRVARGNLNFQLTISGGGYMSTIASALNQTSRRLETHIQREYRAVLSQSNAQYLALQSQINPHFLNNVLSGLVTLNQVGDRQTLERSILRLSHLFGYISKNEDLSTLAREMKFLEEYLSLQTMRFGERLRYSLLSTPEADGVTIPKLLLQPIVENAIIHGMEPYDFDLTVEVLAQVVRRPPLPPVLVIVVQDTGEGFDPASIGPDSTGLNNIRERLELFSADSHMELHSAPGKGCRVFLLLPLERKEENGADSIV